MGATGQSDDTGRRDQGGSRPWWEDRRGAVFAIFLALAGIGTSLMGVVGPAAAIVLVWASTALTLLGLASLVRGRTYARLLGAAARWAALRWKIVVPAVVVVAACVVLGLLWLRGEQSCDDPTEVAVMVPEDGAAGLSAVADAFERDSVNTFSCPEYHVTTFGVGWPALRTALASGWAAAPEQDDASSLAQGPRPDVWLAESGAQADIVAPAGAEQGYTVAGRTLVAGSPLVLAVPEPYAEDVRATVASGDSARELVDAAGAAGLDVVRANPDTSFAAALHTVGLYDDPASDAAALELGLGRALERAGLPFGTDGALLCRLGELPGAEPPRVAVLTTERAMVDAGTGCPASAGATDRLALVPFYPGGVAGLDYTAVRLDWTDAPGERREAGARAFVRWLGEADGQAALERAVRVRGLDGQPPSGVGDLLAGQDVPVVEPGAHRVAYLRVLSAEDRFRGARRPARVLVLVDSSASMGRPADGERNRAEVARRGVLTALGHLGGADQVGIWSFSGAAGSSPRPLLGLMPGPDARQEAPDVLAEVLPSGVTPLYDAIDAGTSYLSGLDPAGASREHLTALVVLTDGENRPGTGPGAQLSAADLAGAATAAEAAGVRVYAIAVGEASCQVSELRQITTAWGGECWDSGFGELESTLDGLFAQLGGR